MASCLVPESPAVMVALEHVRELDKQLRDAGLDFSPEASLHLTKIMAAVADLEEHRRAAREHLEVETIENSKLRQQVNSARDQVSRDLLADVAAARASNVEEMEQLSRELDSISRLREDTEKTQEALQNQNRALHPEREQVKAEHEDLIAALNRQITLKYSYQRQLELSQEQMEELKTRITAMEEDKTSRRKLLDQERRAFTERRDQLSAHLDRVQENIEEQVLRTSRGDLDRACDKKRENLNHLSELTTRRAELENNLVELAASRSRCEEQLEGELRKQREQRQQRAALETELCDLAGTFSSTVRLLREELVAVEEKMEEGGGSRVSCQDCLAQICEVFQHRSGEEREVRAEHVSVSQRLERSERRLEERITSILHHSEEIQQMDQQMRDLLEAGAANKRIAEKNREELCGQVAAGRRNIRPVEEERRRLTQLLEEAKTKQQEHVGNMTSHIRSTRRRYEELQQEEAELLRRQPLSGTPDLLLLHINQSEMDHRQTEAARHQEIQQSAAEAENIRRSIQEKLQELEEKQETLREVEAKCSEEQARLEGLEMLAKQLRRRRGDLERSTRELTERSGALLQPKRNLEEELERLRVSHLHLLQQQASQLRRVEMSVYDNGVQLEQVAMENSRLRLSIRLMMDEVSGARGSRDAGWQQIHRFHEDTRALVESIRDTWRDDDVIRRHSQSSDGALLASVWILMEQLKTRRCQLGHVAALLQQQTLDFSKRLGDKSMT